ncbi:MAG: amidase family protein [Deltaproteobacteria bacterium]|nr:amidase family protein [Deltaproteobacteria bacterium]
MEAIYRKPAYQLAKLIRNRELWPTQLMAETLGRIDALNPKLNAFVALRSEEAMAEARALGKRLADGEDPGPLAGIPIGVKDLEDVKGMATTFGFGSLCPKSCDSGFHSGFKTQGRRGHCGG